MGTEADCVDQSRLFAEALHLSDVAQQVVTSDFVLDPKESALIVAAFAGVAFAAEVLAAVRGRAFVRVLAPALFSTCDFDK